jgi:hypothetical protein
VTVANVFKNSIRVFVALGICAKLSRSSTTHHAPTDGIELRTNRFYVVVEFAASLCTPKNLTGHWPSSGFSIIDPLFRIFDPSFLSFIRDGKALTHWKAFEHIFAVFPARNKNVRHPTAGVATTPNRDFYMMVL